MDSHDDTQALLKLSNLLFLGALEVFQQIGHSALRYPLSMSR
jgi:hypothetical protein